MMTDLPLPDEKYQRDTLEWVKAAIIEGERVLRQDPMYDEIEKSISYIMGDQSSGNRPNTLSNLYNNRTKHIVMQQVAAMTDIHPLFGFKTHNDRFQDQAEILNKLATSWWINSQIDLQLADVVRFAAGPGTGYAEVHWDARAAGGMGDIVLLPRDPRDVLPIRPTLDGPLQNWEGVVIRSAKTINELRARFPHMAHRIQASRPGVIPDRAWGSARRLSQQVMTPAADRLTNMPKNIPAGVPSSNLYYVYMHDRRLHTGSTPLQTGDPKYSWSYLVQPAGAKKPDGSSYHDDEYKLYPRGRLIVCTDDLILYDGPNPYWHGQFPIARLRLDPWPWGLLGVGITRDLLPLQDGLNETMNGILDMVRKALRPALIGDARAMSESMWSKIDMRIPGQKIRHNPILGNITTEPAPALPAYVFDTVKFYVEELDYHGGVANLQAFTKLKQAPGAGTIEQMMEALSPTLRMKGRLLEVFLRDVGEMVKVNFFQFYTMARRIQILGEQGIDMEDFGFDPGSLVPALSKEADGDQYDPAYDFELSRSSRARVHHKQFTFRMTPNSLLAISQISRKMMYMQLWRGGLMDPWTLFEVLEIPNGGSPPSGTKDIAKRIIEANELGLSGQVSPVGRKATGQEPPKMQQKPDASGVPRQTISESG